MDQALQLSRQARHAGWFLTQVVRKFDAAMELAQRRRCARAELRRLLRVGPHMIADIGLDPEAACAEAAKPFWKA